MYVPDCKLIVCGLILCVFMDEKMPYPTVSMVMDLLYTSIGLFGQGKCILRRQSECIR